MIRNRVRIIMESHTPLTRRCVALLHVADIVVGMVAVKDLVARVHVVVGQ